MRKPRTIKEMYQRFSELCVLSVNTDSDCKFLVHKRYWFAVPYQAKIGLVGYDWTLADLTRNGSIILTNTCMDSRKNWRYRYEKNISKARNS